MEEKKTTRASRSISAGWSAALLEAVFGGVQSLVDGLLASISQATGSMVQKMVRRLFLFFSVLLGLLFLFVGFAKTLSAMFGFPGVGEGLVGLFMLLIALVIYAFTRDE